MITKPTEESIAFQIVSTRVFAASRDAVFGAFSDPERLKLWWGPNGFTNTFHEFDFRPGGAWKYVMHGPDGTDYANESEFVEIVRPERIVIDHLRPMHRFLMTMSFDDVDGQTRLTWRMRFDTTAEVDKLRPWIEPANEENFDRLAECLATIPHKEQP